VGNVSFIGLKFADPEGLDEFISEDKKSSSAIKAEVRFLVWLE
jgi:hypothetical protein